MNESYMRACEDEWIAREFCRLMGLDPEELVPLPATGSSLVLRKGPRWQSLTGEVRRALAMRQAIDNYFALPCHPGGTVTAIGDPPIGPDGKPDYENWNP